MSEQDLSIIPGSTVRAILEGNEELVLSAVTEAYLAHAGGRTKTPGTQPLYTNGGRFFAMPASIEDARPIVGAKWVGSFIKNVAAGAERASALLIASDADTGRPIAIVDGTLISAKRTAAGAAVALRLVSSRDSVRSVGLVGCGPINYEVLRFIVHLFPVEHVQLVDLQPARVEAFRERMRVDFPSLTAAPATLGEAMQTADVVSIATNATVPYINELPSRAFVVLHLSLRDLAPDVIARCYNIVDDIEHVCTARTSLHLASEATGHRDFIRATIPDLLAGTAYYERPDVPTVISPFGLATLDLAVLREVLARADGRSDLTRVADFRGGVWA
jgi:ornithine cyclodeaminase